MDKTKSGTSRRKLRTLARKLIEVILASVGQAEAVTDEDVDAGIGAFYLSPSGEVPKAIREDSVVRQQMRRVLEDFASRHTSAVTAIMVEDEAFALLLRAAIRATPTGGIIVPRAHIERWLNSHDRRKHA